MTPIPCYRKNCCFLGHVGAAALDERDRIGTERIGTGSTGPGPGESTELGRARVGGRRTRRDRSRCCCRKRWSSPRLRRSCVRGGRRGRPDVSPTRARATPPTRATPPRARHPPCAGCRQHLALRQLAEGRLQPRNVGPPLVQAALRRLRWRRRQRLAADGRLETRPGTLLEGGGRGRHTGRAARRCAREQDRGQGTGCLRARQWAPPGLPSACAHQVRGAGGVR